MYVYLIYDRVADRHKIGVSSDPVRRLRELQTAHGTPLQLQEQFPTARARQVESRLHQFYGAHQLLGEWFDLPAGAAAGFASRCQFFEDYLARAYASELADLPE